MTCVRGQQSWDLAAASRVLRSRWSRMHTSLNSAQLPRREYRGMHSAFSHSVRVAEKGRPDNEVMVKSVECLRLDCGVLRSCINRPRQLF